jgi:hypothetical protein
MNSKLRMSAALLCSIWAASLAAAEFPPAGDLPSQTALPDPLVMRDGTKIATQADWEAKRKPELKALLQHYMYGHIPPRPKSQEFKVGDARECLNGKALIRNVTIESTDPKTGHPLHVVLITPKDVKNPPVFVGMNFCGNHTLLDDSQIPLPTGWVRNSCTGAKDERATEEGRGSQKDVWNVDLIVDRGYALASFYSGDIDPDTPDLADGIGPTYFKNGSEPAGDDPGTIALWAWGFQRVVDLLVETPGLVDAQRIAIVGHSRNGKTALLAGAFDDRVALIIPHQAGCGGTAPSRTDDPKAESVKRINTAFPHWFSDNFVAFGDDTSKLPFDQHCLLALCAPRPVLYSNAQEDQWANPNGQFEMLRAADPVYKLYGVEGLDPSAKPEIGKLTTSRLGYFLREGKHSMSREDWEVFLDYADVHLKRAK